MGDRTNGQFARDSRRELGRRRNRLLAYWGLAVLAVATGIVAVLALQY
ncbi:hypothetical protein V3C33_14190 [Micrococcaceae bacterium Sec5.7]